MDGAVLTKEAPKLSALERAQIIDELWRSLDSTDQAEVDRVWLMQSRDRLKPFREGKLKAEDGESVLSSIEAELAR